MLEQQEKVTTVAPSRESSDSVDCSGRDPAAGKNPARGMRRSSSRASGNSKQGTIPISQRPTGPRTMAGKQRSSRNAIKSGIFAKGLLLGQESRPEFKSLLDGLRKDLQPQGTFETVLVENLAAIIWRKRRILQAENAAIEKTIQFGSIDSVQALKVEAWDRLRAGETSGGILRPSSNPLLIQEAVDLLTLVRKRLEAVGFRKGHDWSVLGKLYGLDHDGAIPWGLWQIFAFYSDLATEDPKGDGESKSSNELQKEAMQRIDQEIATLKLRLVRQERVAEEKRAYESTAALIPAQDAVDRIIRYEAHLSREFTRALNELERMQRMRRGQPGPPTLTVAINE